MSHRALLRELRRDIHEDGRDLFPAEMNGRAERHIAGEHGAVLSGQDGRS